MLPRDLQGDVDWKYERLSPVQLLVNSGQHCCSNDNHEFVRAAWFWSRRPAVVRAGPVRSEFMSLLPAQKILEMPQRDTCFGCHRLRSLEANVRRQHSIRRRQNRMISWEWRL